MENFRILIIDDNPEIHRDFIKILKTEKSNTEQLDKIKSELFGEVNEHIILPTFEIDTATQGEEGIALIRRGAMTDKPYALAFVDIRMPPGLDGVETIKEILKIDNDIQIVICTAYSDYSWEKIVEHLGQRENLLILKKPFDYVAVRQLSVALTRKWALLNEARAHTRLLEDKVKERTEALHFQATHDSLTKLPNRSYLMDYLEQKIVRSHRELSRFAVMFMDLDRFKLINDSFSHAAGDELLVKFSNRVQENLRERDVLTRIAGDEFIIIISDINSVEAVGMIANKILSVMQKPFQLHGHDIVVTPSIGISIFPFNGKTPDELLRNADMAMYHAKGLGGNQCHFYTDELSTQSLNRLELETDLHEALEKNQFFLCYQPQFDTKANKLLCVEALIRWRHPTRGVLLPIDFIPLTEEIGMYILLGEWVLKTACTQVKEWIDKGLPPVKVAVNITMQQFKLPHLVDMVDAVLKATGLEPHYLELELTEKIVVNDMEAVNKIERLKSLGVCLAIDDFGGGYSSLSYLSKIPLDKLKIDQSFIKNITLNTSDEVIIQAVITMAKNLNLEVMAEGVENEAQLRFLQENACDEVQGFYFSKPLESTQLEKLLRREGEINQ